jgi:hypothetical protein
MWNQECRLHWGVVFGALLVLAAACGGGPASAPTPTSPAEVEQVKGLVTVQDGRTFEYGLLMPQTWAEKYVIRQESNVVHFDYAASPRHTLFSITALTRAQWQEAQMEPGLGTELLSTDGVVFVYNIALDNPYTGPHAEEFQQMAGQVHGVVDSLTVSLVQPVASTNMPVTTVPVTPTLPAIQGSAILLPPDSDAPAAGICAESEGEWATVEIRPDTPSPRCLKVTPEQQLKVINRTEAIVQIELGPFTLELQPGVEGALEKPFGSYLAPGVHRVRVSPYAGPELWLDDSPSSSGPPTASATTPAAVNVVDRFLNWSIVSGPIARPSSHFDFDGQTLAYWAYQNADDRKALALAVESGGEARQVYRVPTQPQWQVEQVEVDNGRVAWLEVGWGDDPRVYRLWVFDLASDVSRLITETQPSPQPHVPAMTLDGDWLVVRALGEDGNTCLFAYDLSSATARGPLCSSSPEVLYGDSYLRGSLLTYVVEDRRQACSFVQQTDLAIGQTKSHHTMSCQAGLRAAADESLLVWPEKVLSQETGEVVEVRLRGLDSQGDIFDLGSERTSYYQVCDGRAYWLSVTLQNGTETHEIRVWAPGRPMEVLYRSAPEVVILGPVCEGDWIAFIKPVSGEIWAARVTGDTASP